MTVAAVGVVAVLLLSAPVTGVDPTPPPGAVVQASRELIQIGRDQSAGVPAPTDTTRGTDAPDPTGVGPTSSVGLAATDRVGTPRRVNAWAAEFLSGATGGQPTAPTDRWVVPLSAGTEPTGVGVIGGPASDPHPDGGSNDATLAAALVRAPNGLLVEDPSAHAWYVVSGEPVTAVNREAQQILGAAEVSLVAARRAIHAEHSSAAAAAAGVEDAVGGSAPSTTAPDAQHDSPARGYLVFAAILGLLALAIRFARRGS